MKIGSETKKACEVVWNGNRWTDSNNILDSYEQDGKFYFNDGQGLFETSELIDLDNLYYNDFNGFIYNEKSIDEYIISDEL
jgi:hypothetical protein